MKLETIEAVEEMVYDTSKIYRSPKLSLYGLHIFQRLISHPFHFSEPGFGQGKMALEQPRFLEAIYKFIMNEDTYVWIVISD